VKMPTSLAYLKFWQPYLPLLVANLHTLFFINPEVMSICVCLKISLQTVLSETSK
jgi:hypothetical protein